MLNIYYNQCNWGKYIIQIKQKLYLNHHMPKYITEFTSGVSKKQYIYTYINRKYISKMLNEQIYIYIKC